MTFAEYPLRFEVLSAVSSGGMGRVDVARLLDVEPEVLVAVKRPHMHMSNDDDYARMFMEEARLTWAIQHPNVARLIGWGRDDESIYMATEFVAGGPLHEIARRGRRQGDPMSAALIAFVIGRAAEGLAAAHGLTFEDGSPCNIVHRDISPSNIMVGFDGRVKIIDFGVAKIAQGGSALRTATGVLKGKVPYMAPEYARGGLVDVTCDLYSLGVVLYELLAGHRPFTAEHDLELLRKVSEDPPPPLLAATPELDPDLAAFVHQLLAKTKQERPASAQSIVTVLDSFLLRQGCSHEQMQHELATYTARYAQGRALSTRTAVGAGPRGDGSPPSHTRESRPPTRALTPASGPPPEHHTRITSDSGVAAAPVADFPPSRPDVGVGVHQASTNSALFVPPPEQVKAPVYLWVAMATGLFSLVIALSALFLVSSRGPQGDAAAVQPPAVARTAPSGVAPVATAEPTATVATTAPTPSASSSAPATATPPSPPSPPKTGTTAPTPVRKPPSAACTPMSFDYPRCLKK